LGRSVVRTLTAAERTGSPGRGICHAHLLTDHLNRTETAAEYKNDGRDHQGELGGDTAAFTTDVTADPQAQTVSISQR
jgi:hypothetical protein